VLEKRNRMEKRKKGAILMKEYVSDCCRAKIYPAIPPDVDPTPICSKCHKLCKPIPKKGEK